MGGQFQDATIDIYLHAVFKRSLRARRRRQFLVSDNDTRRCNSEQPSRGVEHSPAAVFRANCKTPNGSPERTRARSHLAASTARRLAT